MSAVGKLILGTFPDTSVKFCTRIRRERTDPWLLKIPNLRQIPGIFKSHGLACSLQICVFYKLNQYYPTYGTFPAYGRTDTGADMGYHLVRFYKSKLSVISDFPCSPVQMSLISVTYQTPFLSTTHPYLRNTKFTCNPVRRPSRKEQIFTGAGIDLHMRKNTLICT